MSDMPWSEKYRPRSFEEMVGQEHIVQVLKYYLKKGNLPHMLFVGPPGVGKTTAGWIIAYQKFGNYARNCTLELNASDERGIGTIREKVKQFLRIRLGGDTKFKLLILDEADYMTADAQAALRRMMEQYSDFARIILIVNNDDKIIKPIKSRCATFRFNPIKPYDVWRKLKQILNAENMENISNKLSTDFVDILYREKHGDLREIINTFQVMVESGTELTPENLTNFLGKPDMKELEEIIHLALNGNFRTSWEKVNENIYVKGWTLRQILSELSKNLFDIVKDEQMQIKVSKELGECEGNITFGGNDIIQFQSFIARLAEVGSNNDRGKTNKNVV